MTLRSGRPVELTWTVVWEQGTLAAFRKHRLVDAVGAKACAAAIRSLADDPRPDEASPLGGSGYYRLAIGTWRVLYQVEGEALYVVNIGRVG